MNIEVLERKENPLLKREEITFKIEHSGEQTPSRETVIAKLAAIINAEKQRTVLKEIRSQFGLHESIGYANLYENAEQAILIEPKHILIRNGILEGEKAE